MSSESATESASSNDSNPLSYYVSLFSGACLIISELLPYISKVKGNGIVQILMQSFSRYEDTKRKESDEQQRLFESIVERLDRLTSLVQQEKNPPTQQ
jgi:hypothetical protein